MSKGLGNGASELSAGMALVGSCGGCGRVELCRIFKGAVAVSLMQMNRNVQPTEAGPILGAN